MCVPKSSPHSKVALISSNWRQASSGDSSRAASPASQGQRNGPAVCSSLAEQGVVGRIVWLPSTETVLATQFPHSPLLSHVDFKNRPSAWSHPCFIISEANEEGRVLCFQVTSFSQNTDLCTKHKGNHANIRRQWLEVETPGQAYNYDEQGNRLAHDGTMALAVAEGHPYKREWICTQKATCVELSALGTKREGVRLTTEAVNYAISMHNGANARFVDGLEDWMGKPATVCNHIPPVEARSSGIAPSRTPSPWFRPRTSPRFQSLSPRTSFSTPTRPPSPSTVEIMAKKSWRRDSH